MKKKSLVHMKAGQRGKIIEINNGVTIENKLMHRGIYPGREIIKISQFALRGPVTIKVGRAVVALGHNMAGKIIMETND